MICLKIKFYLSIQDDYNYFTNHVAMNILMKCIKYDYFQLFQYLITHFKDHFDINAVDIFNRTALYYAIENINSNINYFIPRKYKSITKYKYANQMVELLIDTYQDMIDINIQTISLTSSAIADTIKYIDKYEQIANARTILHVAICKMNYKIIKLLIEKFHQQILINILDDSGYSILHLIAIKLCDEDEYKQIVNIFKLIINTFDTSKNINLCTINNVYGTLLHILVNQLDLKLIQFIVNKFKSTSLILIYKLYVL